jgi:hypothetical protein
MILTTMLFSIFILINLCFTLLFLYIIYRAAVLLKKEIGVWAVIIFILGILPKSSNSAEKSKTEWKYNSDKVFVNGAQGRKYHTLEDNLVSKVELMVNYELDSVSQKYLPTEANIINSGLIVGGSRLIPQLITIKPTESPKHLEYHIQGMRKWQFFYLFNYSEDKRFAGFINIK